MSKYTIVYPDTLSREEVKRICGGDVTCRWCGRTSTARKPGWAEWSDWVLVPFSRSRNAFVCDVCALDVYYAVASTAISDYPDQAVVQNAAKVEGMSEREFRLHCIDDQLRIVGVVIASKDSAVNKQRRDDISATSDRLLIVRKTLIDLVE